MRRLTEIDVKGRRVLVRVDFNVNLKKGDVMNDVKIRASLPTINYLLQNEAKIILCSHLGRPQGREPELSLRPLAKHLSWLLEREVKFSTDCIGEEVEGVAKALKPGEVLLLENVRFYAGEWENDTSFAHSLSRLAEIYINDAFAACHRRHASVEAITNFLPHAAGFSLERELQMLEHLISNPSHPFAIIQGGEKLTDKIKILERLVEKADLILLGGAVCATFLKSLGYPVGKSPIEPDMLPLCRKILDYKEKIVLPIDVLVANEAKDVQKAWAVNIKDVPKDCLIVDIGPETVALFSEKLRDCKTVFWNGPMGIIEIAQFASGTLRLAEALSSIEGVVVAGGGSTSGFLFQMGLADKLSYVCIGGGASLKFISGEKLPGIEALKR